MEWCQDKTAMIREVCQIGMESGSFLHNVKAKPRCAISPQTFKAVILLMAVAWESDGNHNAVTGQDVAGLKITPRLLRLFITTRNGSANRRCRTHPSSAIADCSLSQCQSSEPSPASGFTVK
jgi:hypothetical protein